MRKYTDNTWNRHWAQIAAALPVQETMLTPTDVEAGASSIYGRMILGGFQKMDIRSMYQGQATETEQGVNGLAKRRAKNKIARKSRRINRHG